jgi:hypothetical protein
VDEEELTEALDQLTATMLTSEAKVDALLHHFRISEASELELED